MKKPQTKTLMFYRGNPDDEKSSRGVATLTAEKIVLVSQYCDLRDANGDLVATITWTGDVKVREV